MPETPVAVVTALRERGRRVEVEVDGTPWRSVPLDAAARVGLRVGLQLDRPRLRELRRELRRNAAGTRALRALRARDLAAAELEHRLERGGFTAGERSDTLARLERTGLLDDRRFAESRARTLARRGYGDAAVRWELQRRGLAADDVDAAVGALDPEAERAAAIVAARGTGPATARLLARRGFGEEAVAAAAGAEA